MADAVQMDSVVLENTVQVQLWLIPVNVKSTTWYGLLQCIVTSRGNEQSLSKNPIPNGAKSFTSSNKGREFIGPDVTLKLCGTSSWVIVTIGGRKYFWKPWLLIL